MQRTSRKYPRPLPADSLSAARVIWRAACVACVVVIAPDSHAQIQQPGTLGQIPPGSSENTRPGESLTEQLDRSDGVIKPPAGIDPKIETPAPEPDPRTTPVIPPPGSSGGDPNVQPK